MDDDNRSPAEPVAGKPVSGEPDPDDSPTKKRHKPTRDRLSELPDLALAYILSHLYVEEAARTSVLSKRFNSLWQSVTALTFSDEHSGKRGELFVSFVDTALGFHCRSDIEKFSVRFKYGFKYSKIVDGWIKFALQKQVKLLHLNLYHSKTHPVFDVEHELPKFLYENQKLVELVTSCCKFTSERGINWSSLKLLSITRTKLDEGLISWILAHCLVLETLELRDCGGFDQLKIRSASLRVLRIVGEQPQLVTQPQDENLLEISGPNLVSLEVSGPLYRTKVRLSDLGSLVSTTMDFEIKPNIKGSMSSWFAVRDQDIAREVLESLCLVKELTVGRWYIEALSKCEAYNLSSPWSERKSLTLRIPVAKWDHLGIVSFLRSSPYMEKLVIRLSYCSNMCDLQHTHVPKHHDEEYIWNSWSTISKCPLLHLKTVKVVDFRASSCGVMKNLFPFLQFLLKNSKVLEEIVIQTSRYVTKGALDEALKLLSVPVASPDAVVHFDPPHLWVDPLCMHQVPAPL